MTQVIFEDRIISGGFTFDVKNDTVILCAAIKNLEGENREVVDTLAKETLQQYATKIKAATEAANGTRVNALAVRREAVEAAQKAVTERLGEEKVKAAQDALQTVLQSFNREKKALVKMIVAELRKNPVIKRAQKTPIDRVVDETDSEEVSAEDFEL